MQNVGECFVYLILIELLIKFYAYFSLFPRCQWFFCDIVNYCKILIKRKKNKKKNKLSTIKLINKNETHKFNKNNTSNKYPQQQQQQPMPQRVKSSNEKYHRKFSTRDSRSTALSDNQWNQNWKCCTEAAKRANKWNKRDTKGNIREHVIKSSVNQSLFTHTKHNRNRSTINNSI